MQHPKSQLVNMNDWADAATALIRHFIHETLEAYVTDPVTLQDIVNKWTMSDSVRWVQAYLDDEFNRQMKWAKETSAADDLMLIALTEILMPYLGEGMENKKNQRHLLDAIVDATDPVVIIITEYVVDVVRPNPWWVWSIRYRYDVALVESDEDYRIHVFNEKVESGEWSLK